MMNMNDGLYIGVDGCRGGWIACVLNHGEFRFERFDSLEQLVSHYPEFDAFLIDMAVGLRSSADQLRPDDLARKELGQKSSSIFPIPCRQAVYADSEEEQKQTNIRILGKSLSKQTVHIIPKIKELDEYLSLHPEYKNRILESHPELGFARLHGHVLMTRKKEFPGFMERVNILGKYFPGKPLTGLWEKAREFKCNPDDLLDPDRGANLGWKTLKNNLSQYMTWLDKSAPELRHVTGSSMAGAVQRYCMLACEKRTEGRKITLHFKGYKDEAYCFLRLNKGDIAKVSGGKLKKLTGNLYILTIQSDVVTIERQETD